MSENVETRSQFDRSDLNSRSRPLANAVNMLVTAGARSAVRAGSRAKPDASCPSCGAQLVVLKNGRWCAVCHQAWRVGRPLSLDGNNSAVAGS